MKGVLFNVVEDVVTQAFSADVWDDVVEQSGTAGAYTSLGNYPDSEFGSIVEATGLAAGQSVPDTLRLAGQLGFAHLVRRAPALLDGLNDWRSVLTSLDDIIHPEVRKIYPDADVPGFATESDGADLLVTYTSKRGFCALAEGLMIGSGNWFDTELTVTHLSCVHSGDAQCVMRVSEST